jgi:hypothetical protein
MPRSAVLVRIDSYEEREHQQPPVLPVNREKRTGTAMTQLTQTAISVAFNSSMPDRVAGSDHRPWKRDEIE